MCLAIFIPGSLGVRTDLETHGLGDLAIDKMPSVQADALPKGEGIEPGERPGAVFAWGSPASGGYVWTKHKIKSTYYVGLPPGDLDPRNIQRAAPLISYPLSFRGYQWNIPVASSLPAVNRVDPETGEFERDVLPWHKVFQEKAAQVANTIFQAIEQSDILKEYRPDIFQEETITVQIGDVFEFAVHALSLNYRVNAHIVDRLGLLREDRDLFAVAQAVIEYPLIEAARYGAIKKKDLTPKAFMPV